MSHHTNTNSKTIMTNKRPSMTAASAVTAIILSFFCLIAMPLAVVGYDCALPSVISDFAFITSADADITAKTIEKDIAVGMIFQQIIPEHTIEINGLGYVMDMQADNVHWNGGLKIGSAAVQDVVDFQHFKFLAEMAVDTFTDNETVFVVTSGGGGCWSNDDFGGSNVLPNTLVIFNTWQDICIQRSSDGMPFVPTVIAPYSRVEVQQEVGAVNGTIVARDLYTTGTDRALLTSLEFRKYCADTVGLACLILSGGVLVSQLSHLMLSYFEIKRWKRRV
jgi:hypothetical protein